MTVDAPHLADSEATSRFGSGASYSASLSADAFLSLGCMEGLYDSIVAPAPAVEDIAARRAALWPGYILAGSVAALAYLVHYLPVAPFGLASESGIRHPISAAMIAILAGLILRNTMPLPDSIKAGCKRIVKKGIPIAIVLTGAGLNLLYMVSVGFKALTITVMCVGLALAAGYYFGRLFGLGSKTAILLGVGTGICGNSAIVAVAPLIDAKDDDLVLSVGTVNLFGLLAMLTWPLVGGWLALADESFGVWSGTSIHAVPQVVAAGFAYSTEAGTLATLVKLVRVALLAPMVFILALLYARHRTPGSNAGGQLTVHYARLVPWFVWGFLAFALLNTLGLIPTLNFQLANFLSGSPQQVSVSVGELLTQTGKMLLTLAMAAIGLEVNVRQLAGVGGRALTAGLVSTAVLGAASLALITLFL